MIEPGPLGDAGMTREALLQRHAGPAAILTIPAAIQQGEVIGLLVRPGPERHQDQRLDDPLVLEMVADQQADRPPDRREHRPVRCSSGLLEYDDLQERIDRDGVPPVLLGELREPLGVHPDRPPGVVLDPLRVRRRHIRIGLLQAAVAASYSLTRAPSRSLADRELVVSLDWYPGEAIMRAKIIVLIRQHEPIYVLLAGCRGCYHRNVTLDMLMSRYSKPDF